MRKWLPAIVLLCVAAGLGVYFLHRPPRQSPSAASALASAPTTVTTQTQILSAPPVSTMTNRVTKLEIATLQNNSPSFVASTTPPTTPPISLPEPTVPEQELPQLPAATVLENVRSAFRQYQSKFGGNPVGTNLEITRALNGQNSRQIRFLRMEDGMRVNSKGELIDTWGTPYFFHQLSGTEMEIHSAGPDKKMWTEDDLVIE